jgi:hypothetical protein
MRAELQPRRGAKGSTHPANYATYDLILRSAPKRASRRMGHVPHGSRRPLTRAPHHEGYSRLRTWGDLPVGRFVDRAVESYFWFSEKYFCSHSPQIRSRTFRIPPHQRGVSRSSRTRGGVRWTRQRFARDGVAGRVERLVSDQQRADERCCSVRRSRVVLTPRRWRQVRGCYVGPTGLRHNVSPWATVANKPGHRGELEGNR